MVLPLAVWRVPISLSYSQDNAQIFDGVALVEVVESDKAVNIFAVK